MKNQTIVCNKSTITVGMLKNLRSKSVKIQTVNHDKRSPLRTQKVIIPVEGLSDLISILEIAEEILR